MLDIIGIYPGNKIWLSFMLCPDPPGFRAARYCFLLLLSCSTWPCLGHAEKHLPAFFHLSWTGYRISSGRSARLWVKKVIPQCNSGILIILTIDRSGPRRQQMRCPLLQLSGDAWGLLPPQRWYCCGLFRVVMIQWFLPVAKHACLWIIIRCSSLWAAIKIWGTWVAQSPGFFLDRPLLSARS